MKNSYLFLFLLCFTITASAQVTFQKWYGSASAFDYSLSGCPVSSGGYIILMNSDSTPSGSLDMVLLRTDANGNETWRRYFGSATVDIGTGVVETSDGGFAICGSWKGLGTDSATVIKTDASGNLQWQRIFKPVSTGRSVPQDILALSDGSLVVCGLTGPASLPDGFITKFSASGATVWQKVYGGANVDEFIALAEVNGTGFILSGISNSYSPSTNFWLVRTDVNGDTLWTRSLGTALPEESYDVVCTQDGGFAAVGFENTTGGNVVLIKTDASGAQQWLRTYNGGGWEVGRSLVETSDGGFALTGRKEPSSMYNHMWLIRTDNAGVQLWDRIYPSGQVSEGYEVHLTSDGGFLIVGHTNNISGDAGQAYVVKTESNGLVGLHELQATRSDFIFSQDFTNGAVYFQFTEALPGRTVRIMNMEGKVVAMVDASDLYVQFGLGELATGMYAYSVYTSNAYSGSGRFLKP